MSSSASEYLDWRHAPQQGQWRTSLRATSFQNSCANSNCQTSIKSSLLRIAEIDLRRQAFHWQLPAAIFDRAVLEKAITSSGTFLYHLRVSIDCTTALQTQCGLNVPPILPPAKSVQIGKRKS
jgi:hypothetical protein